MNTEILCIIDRSGSMERLRDDSIGGFNAFLREQQAVPGDANLTLVLFDHEYTVLYEGRRLGDVKPLTRDDYVPRGQTALLDAIGRTITEQGARIARQLWAEKIVVCVLTDGHENASREYTNERIRSMVGEAEKGGKWSFVYLGANQDAFDVACSMGMSARDALGNVKLRSFGATGQGVHDAYMNTSSVVSASRTNTKLPDPIPLPTIDNGAGA